MTQYQLLFFLHLFFTWNHLVELQSNYNHSSNNHNSNCPHLFKILTDCTCVHPHTIDCTSSKTITHLPQSWKSTNHNLTLFTQSITRFDLIHTPSIITIKTDAFQVSATFILSLSRTSISFIEKGLQNLQHLSIIHTGLVHINPHAFRHLHRLHDLRIEFNENLVELKTFSLSNIQHIHRISLISNSIRLIQAEVFRNTHFVDIIDLTDNPLEIIQSYAFNGLKSIGTLILCTSNTCPIKQIDPYAFFGFHTCDTIYLTGLHISLHSQIFSDMTSIRLVNLSHGEISHIYPYVFQNSENLGELDLSSSLIANIHPHAFDDLVNVSLLNLNGNLIRIFDKSIFQQLIFSIKRIDLDNNPIQCDCTLEWYLEQRSHRFKLPDVCTGPKGYECLSPNELQQSQLPCYLNSNQTQQKNLCEKQQEKDLAISTSVAPLYRLNLVLFIFFLLLFKF